MSLYYSTVPDGFVLMNRIDRMIDGWAEWSKIPVAVFFAIGLALALVVGLFGCKLLRLVLSCGFAGLGFTIAAELVALFPINAGSALPWINIGVGVVLAALFLWLSFRRFSYMLFMLLVAIASYIVAFYTAGSITLSICLGVFVALFAMRYVRFVFRLMTSFVGGALAVRFLGNLLPDVSFLQLGDESAAFFVAIGVVVVFFLLQLLIGPRKAKKKKKKADEEAAAE